MDTPTGRQPKKHLAIRPKLAQGFRQIARRERTHLSDLFEEMFRFWLSRKRKGQYPEVEKDLHDDE